MFCTNCGKELHIGDKFCSQCGTPVRAAETPSVDEKKYIPSFKEEAEKKTSEISQAIAEENRNNNSDSSVPVTFDWNLDGFPSTKPRKTEEIDFNWGSVVGRKTRVRETEVVSPFTPVKKAETKVEVKEEPIDFAAAEKKQAEEEKARALEIEKEKIDVEIDAEPEEEPMSIEELERELFQLDSPQEKCVRQDDYKKNTAQLEKFYTYNQKNEAFQQLLDKEYERLKGIEREAEPVVNTAFDIKTAEPKLDADSVLDSVLEIAPEITPEVKEEEAETVEAVETAEPVTSATIDFSAVREEARSKKLKEAMEAQVIEPETEEEPETAEETEPEVAAESETTSECIEEAEVIEETEEDEEVEAAEETEVTEEAEADEIAEEIEAVEAEDTETDEVAETEEVEESEEEEVVEEAEIPEEEIAEESEELSCAEAEKVENAEVKETAEEAQEEGECEEAEITESEEIEDEEASEDMMIESEAELEEGTEADAEEETDAEVDAESEVQVEAESEEEAVEEPEASEASELPEEAADSEEDASEEVPAETPDEAAEENADSEEKVKLRHSDIFPREEIEEAEKIEKEEKIKKTLTAEGLALDELDEEDDEDESGSAGGIIMKLLIALLVVLIAVEGVLLGIKFLAPESEMASKADDIINSVIGIFTGEDEVDEEITATEQRVSEVVGEVEKPESIGQIDHDMTLKYDMTKELAFEEAASSAAFTDGIWLDDVTYCDKIIGTVVDYYGNWINTNEDETLIGINKLEIGEIRTGELGYYVLHRLTFAAADGQEKTEICSAFIKVAGETMEIDEVKEEVL